MPRLYGDQWQGRDGSEEDQCETKFLQKNSLLASMKALKGLLYGKGKGVAQDNASMGSGAARV